MGLRVGLVELGAMLWGFAEATLFFIVPDVWLSAWVPRAPRRALVSCLFAVVGALAGGVIMYAWGQRDPDGAIAVVDRVPAISDHMARHVDGAVRRNGAVALFGGLFTGAPYKLFAVTAGANDIDLATFLLVSVPARLIRFLGVTSLIMIAARVTRRRLDPRTQTALVIAGWIVFYVFFFSVMPN